MTRRQKVLQRTRVGASLALLVALLLWGASTSIGGWITLATSVVLTLWCIFEVDRMALFRTAFARLGATATCALGASLMAYGQFRPSPRSGDVASWLLLIALLAGIGGVLAAAFGAGAPPLERIRPAGESETLEEKRARIGLPSLLVVPLIGLPLLYLFPIRQMGGTGALVSFVVLAKIGDIFGYYIGNLLGKRHPFPRLSPGKTVAGCVASLIAGTAFGGLLVAFGAMDGPRYGVVSGLLFGALVNVAAQAGDLMESGLKRRSAIKDSGTTFGPSGGMLDLVDSFLLAAPLAALAWPFLFTS